MKNTEIANRLFANIYKPYMPNLSMPISCVNRAKYLMKRENLLSKISLPTKLCGK